MLRTNSESSQATEEKNKHILAFNCFWQNVSIVLGEMFDWFLNMLLLTVNINYFSGYLITENTKDKNYLLLIEHKISQNSYI